MEVGLPSEAKVGDKIVLTYDVIDNKSGVNWNNTKGTIEYVIKEADIQGHKVVVPVKFSGNNDALDFGHHQIKVSSHIVDTVGNVGKESTAVIAGLDIKAPEITQIINQKVGSDTNGADGFLVNQTRPTISGQIHGQEVKEKYDASNGMGWKSQNDKQGIVEIDISYTKSSSR